MTDSKPFSRRSLLRMFAHGMTYSHILRRTSNGVFSFAAPLALPEALIDFHRQQAVEIHGNHVGGRELTAGDPSRITAADYAQVIIELVSDPAHETAWLYEATHRDGNGTLDRGERVRGSWAVLYESFLYAYYQRQYRRSADPRDRERAQQAASYAALFADWWARGVAMELPKPPDPPQPPALSFVSGFGEGCQLVWWGSQWLDGAEEQGTVERILLNVSETCLRSYLPYNEFGANNRAFYAAVWYDIALAVGAFQEEPAMAESLKAYAQTVWEDWYPFREHEEDDAHYGMANLMQLSTWLAVRGMRIDDDPALAAFWAQNAAQIMNDGTWPSYGGGPIAPVDGLVRAIVIAEDAARATRDGMYKTLGHRSFWFFHSHMKELKAWSYFEYEVLFLTFAYMAADETIRERPLLAQPIITRRRKIRRNETWPTDQPFHFEAAMIDSKVIMRSGHDTSDLCLLIQARDQGGHGRPDIPSILWMGQDHSALLYNGVARLDSGMRFHNIVNIQDPDYPELDVPWDRASYALSEVAAHGFTSRLSYTRIEVTGDPAFPATPERWENIRRGNVPTYGHPRAIGYNNYPAEASRAVLMVHNRFVLVHDLVRFTLDDLRLRVGPNWVTQVIDDQHGANWVNTRIERMHCDDSGLQRAPLTNQPRNLLIWFAPKAEASLLTEDLNSGRPHPTDPYQRVIDTARRAWYREEKTRREGEVTAFTTLLWPHSPGIVATTLASSVQSVEQTSLCSILKVAGADGVEELIWINRTMRPKRILAIETDAEAGYALVRNGRVEHLSCVRATVARINGIPIPIDPSKASVEVSPLTTLHQLALPLL